METLNTRLIAVMITALAVALSFANTSLGLLFVMAALVVLFVGELATPNEKDEN